MAICQNIVLNTNATESGTASVTKMVTIVLLVVKHSVLQTYLSQNLPTQRCPFTHLSQETAVWSFWSPSFEMTIISWYPFLQNFCWIWHRRPDYGTMVFPVAWGTQKPRVPSHPSVINVGGLFGSWNFVKLIPIADLLWGQMRGIVWFHFSPMLWWRQPFTFCWEGWTSP